jgi:RNA polymerase sigma-70 factor (ECF subfamily)
MSGTLATYSDSELFALMQSDKRASDAAFKELYDRHNQRVYAYCLRVTGSQDDARDIFQECFIKFYNAALSANSNTNPAGLLLKIARNHCLNYKRDRKDNISFKNEHAGIDLSQSYEQKELLELIGMALKHLEFEYREVFVLRLYHGMEYTEISDITGEPANTVRTRVWRAKEKIKAILSPYVTDVDRL